MIFFKTNLKYILKRLRVSQEEIALQAKVRSTTISNYVNGVSTPGIEELVAICQFFGVSVDSFLFLDFEKGNLITDEDVTNFKAKGKLIGKGIGKLMAQNNTTYQANNTRPAVVNETEENMLWAVLSTLRQMDGKLDHVRAGVDSLNKKKV